MTLGNGAARRGLFALLFIAILGFLHAPSARAEFQGHETTDRDYDYMARYFFHVLTFSEPWRWDAFWRERDTAYRIELGSVVSDEFYLRQEAKIARELDDWVTVGFQFFQGEDYDGRYVNHRVWATGPDVAGFTPSAYAQVDPFKIRIDLGLGLEFEAPGLYRGSVEFCFVDWVYNLKAHDQDGRYLDEAYTLRHASSLVPRVWPLEVRFTAEIDFPLALDLPAEQQVFHFRRTRIGLEALAELADGWEGRFRITAEWASKKWDGDGYAPASPITGWFDRDAGGARIELGKRWDRANGFEERVEFGLFWNQLLESWRYPNDDFRDRRLWKRDVVAYASGRVWLGAPFYLEGKVFLGSVEHVDAKPTHKEDTYEKRHPAATKIDVFLGLWFGDGQDIAILLSFEPDVMEFGGGGVVCTLGF